MTRFMDLSLTTKTTVVETLAVFPVKFKDYQDKQIENLERKQD